jgi:hypothetical protein
MRQISEAELAAWHEEIHRRKDSRLIANRYFQGHVTAVTGGGPFEVAVQRIGETVADGNTYHCAVPGYIPQLGDLVELVWRDDAVAHVDHPINMLGSLSTVPTSSVIDSQIIATLSGSLTSLTIPKQGVLPKGFNSLTIRWQVRTTSGNTVDTLYMQFNGDTSANYNWEYMGALGTAYFTPGVGGGDTKMWVGDPAGGGSAAGAVGAGKIDILNYGGTVFRKQYVALCIRDDNSGFGQAPAVGDWLTAGTPITSITLFLSAGNYAVGSWVVTEGHP